MNLRFPRDANYELNLIDENDPDVPERFDITINLSRDELRRANLLFEQLRSRGSTKGKARVRNAIIKIIGRETMELIEAQARDGRQVDIRLTTKEPPTCSTR